MSDDLVEMARLAQHDERMSTGALYGDLADRIEELEAKLAKAVEALETIVKPKTGPDFDWARAGWYRRYTGIARTTLAELTGGKDE